ncbi:hypothetical protein HQ35_04480 [Porphyromonas cangingivalis]|uniref:Uncharacterized protein n=1 Tax=Porphyromonas cangingivalis TaxID=36874 RepID=A0A0A2EQV8_PORCN|nr:HlyD family efflux transporter periplasmic adaptor subunit [Porphyromonas cangingivalis]KGN81298.1 hypothetical protein HQ35_04480 [Porphyromonas cangingivalis]
MKKIYYKSISTGVMILLLGVFCSCGNQHSFDASGAFEAEKVVVSSQAQGVIMEFNVEEGAELRAGETIGYVDSTQLHLKREQLLAQIEAVSSRKPEMALQLASLEEQLATAKREKERLTNLVRGDAATQKQLDDAEAHVKVLQRQITAQRSSLQISVNAIDKETKALQVQVKQVEDQLQKCRIVNPIRGTVLAKYASANEITAIGKPLYRIVDLSEMTLRVYITGDQLPKLKLNQQVTVYTDNGDGGFTEAHGTVTWISDKAEFTPKTIQTRDERANLVYAVKIKVANDGMYKIGMYGEITFN